MASLDVATAMNYVENHSAIWTGTEMIAWGGYNGVHFRNGGRWP